MRSLATPSRPTWEELAAGEPRLLHVLAAAQRIGEDFGSDPRFCADDWFHRRGGLKTQVVELVGWRRKDNAVLGTPGAYDVAYQRVFDVLPNCRDCSCFRSDN